HPAPAPPSTHPLSLHAALPICPRRGPRLPVLPAAELVLAGACFTGAGPQADGPACAGTGQRAAGLRHAPVRPRARRRGLALRGRSEEHTSELQSRFDLVCRLLL